MWGFQQRVGSEDKLYATGGWEHEQSKAQDTPPHPASAQASRKARQDRGWGLGQQPTGTPGCTENSEHRTGRRYTHDWAPLVEEAAVNFLMEELREKLRHATAPTK